MALISIDDKDAEKKLGIVRRYLPEIAYLSLATCIVFLFTGQREIEKDMRQYLNSDRMSGVQTITENTSVIKANTEVMREVKEILNSQNSKQKK